ncbi:MAG: methyltransferase [Candidatus Latescibacteria bacterium]|nr:methyltransferase [Candidatus Latescibacterota bacterium]
MTSRERVLAALNHNEPDRIPLDLGGTESSCISGIAYNRLKKYLGIKSGETCIYDVYQQITKIEGNVRSQLEIDTIPLLFEPKQWKPFRLPDNSSCMIPEKWNPEGDGHGNLVVKNQKGEVTAIMPRGGYYFEPVNPPLKDINDSSELNANSDVINSYDLPTFADETLETIGDRARYLYEKTDYAIVANLQMHLLAAGQQLRGFENFMVDLLINKPLAHALLERLNDAYIERCSRYLKQVKDCIQIVLVNDDLGTQTGPMLSVDCYREMIWPYQKRLFEFIKKESGAYILFHSCGSVKQFIPSLIEAGVDALNPVQVSAAEMDTKELKKEFGRDITFWGGGCDTQHVLGSGTPGEIRDEVKRRIDDLAARGGFVFTQVHNIQPDVPPDNIMAMYEAFHKYREHT